MHFFQMREVFLSLYLAGLSLLCGGEVYFTGFENFTVGDDKIAGTDSWVGTYNNLKLHGVTSEALHGVVGIGNAAFIGGFATTVTKTTSGGSLVPVYVRKPINLDPLSLNQEIATFSVVFGIKDSSVIPLTVTRRDDFEFLIYNQSNQLLAGLQFDNTTLDGFGKPRRLIYRLEWNSTTSTYQYVLTSETFLSEILETLQFRINYRTNRWTVSLSDVPVFQDLPFYSGIHPKNLGSIMVKMLVGTSNVTSLLPGDNYLIFDDFAVRTDDLTTVLTVSKTATGAAALAWNEEAGTTYQLQYSNDCSIWKFDLAASNRTASLTQSVSYTDPTVPIPTGRFYRIKRNYP